MLYIEGVYQLGIFDIFKGDKKEKLGIVISGVRLYSVDDLAIILNLSNWSVTKLFREKKFKGIKLAKRYYLSKDNLEKYLDAKDKKG